MQTSNSDRIARCGQRSAVSILAVPGSRDEVRKLVLCSGKIYYDIVGHEERPAARQIAVARVEQLYPFPEHELCDLMTSYPNLERVVWVQEEPRNMGARAFMRRRMATILPTELSYDYIGRQLRAAPGEGYTAAHKRELVEQVIGAEGGVFKSLTREDVEVLFT